MPIGEIVGNLLPALQAGAGGAGLLGNVMNMVTQGQQVNKLKEFENMSPQQLSGLVTSAEKPLSQDLLNSVGNTVQADVASRGLAESPGIFANTETQALAPFQQQQQQMALQLILQKMGLPAEIIANLTKNANVSSLFQKLGQNSGAGGGTGGASSPSIQQLVSLFQPTNAPSDPGLTTPNNFTGDTNVDTGSFSG